MILKTVLVASAALLSLSGCASLQRQQDRLAPSLLGQPVTALTARYGHPLVIGNHREYTLGRGFSARSTGVNAPVSGYVGTTPFEGTVRVPGKTYVTPTHCKLRVVLDRRGEVSSVQLRGDAATCREALG